MSDLKDPVDLQPSPQDMEVWSAPHEPQSGWSHLGGPEPPEEQEQVAVADSLAPKLCLGAASLPEQWCPPGLPRVCASDEIGIEVCSEMRLLFESGETGDNITKAKAADEDFVVLNRRQPVWNRKR